MMDLPYPVVHKNGSKFHERKREGEGMVNTLLYTILDTKI
jgi:hypothetical protein